MAFDKKGLDDYVDVATRIAEFRARYPEGSLSPWDPAKPYEIVSATGVSKDGREFTATLVVVVAAAYREPGDACPGVGMAWEVFPGRTPYTLGSELMNAETSAWGRAIIAVGAADSRAGIASREEVRNRSAEREDGLPVNSDGTVARSKLTEEQRRDAGIMTNAQTREHTQLRKLDHPRPAERASGPLPDDEWTAPAEGDKPGTSTLGQQQMIASRLAAKGVASREDKLAFCSFVAQRPIGSSKELSFTEAVEVLRQASEIPATTTETRKV